MQEGSKAKEESIQLEAQLNVVEFVKNYVTDKTRSSDLIPNVSGVGDVGVQSQIESYNEMMLQRNRLVTNSGENNPVVQNMNRNLDAMRKTIAGSIENIAQYDVIYVGFPNWWGDMPMILYTFFDSYDLSGKTIAPFCTSGGSGLSNTVNEIKSLEPGAAVTKGLHISSGSSSNPEHAVSAWLDDIGLAK